MSVDLTWELNGVDLDSDPGFLTSVSVWRPNLSTRRTPIVIPGLHGVIDPGLPVFDEPTVTLSIRVSQPSQQALEHAVNDLVRLVAQPVLTLTRVSGGITASAAARLVSANFEDFLVGATERLLIVLAVPQVFFREAPQTTAQQGFAADVSNAPVGHLGGSTGPIRDAVVQVQGPATAVQVSDPASGTGIPAARVLAETASGSTVGNARNSVALMIAKGVTSYTLISHWTHLRRAQVHFLSARLAADTKAGKLVSPVPCGCVATVDQRKDNAESTITAETAAMLGLTAAYTAAKKAG